MKFSFVIRRVLQPFLGFLGFFILVVLIINMSIFDEAVNPEVAEIMQPVQMPPEKENAYFALWGLSAASEKDMMAAGIGIIARYRSNRDKNGSDEISSEDYQEFFGGKDFDKEWLKTYSPCQSITEFGCLAKMSAQLTTDPVQSERLRLMLNRYDQIMQMTKFQHLHGASITTPLPTYSPILRLNQIKLAQLYNLDAHDQFLIQAATDMKFWRMVLVQDNTLIDQLIAAASIWSDLQYLSEFIRTKQLSLESYKKAELLIKPLTPQELDISEAFIAEAATMYRHLPKITSEEINSLFNSNALPLSLLLQPKATNNRHFENFIKPIIRLSKQPKEVFYQTVQSDQFNLGENIKVNFSPSSLYNLVGKMLLNLSIWSPTDYIARMHDLNGMISLVKLQLQLKQTATDSIEEAVKNSSITNPYTGEPMDYDKENNWLGFKCLEATSQCRIKL